MNQVLALGAGSDENFRSNEHKPWDRQQHPKLLDEEGRAHMAKCEVCGNEYDKTFEVITGGVRHTFDSFECPIQVLAPSAAVLENQ